MLKPIQVVYKEDSYFQGRTEQETKEYNDYQQQGLELYKRCNFDKELKRNKDKYIEEYTKFFIFKDDETLMTVSPMKNLYPHGYYEHCKSHTIYVDHDNKCLLLV